tara:strand:- start:62 stop:400 length:339 start_codon:yes stop_codon:yes gene_type:complete
MTQRKNSMADRQAQERLEKLGELQQSLGLLNNVEGKSSSELAMMFPRSKFTELDEGSYFSMLDSIKDNVIEPETTSEPTSKDYNQEMKNMFNNVTLDMDNLNSLNLLDSLDT